MVKRYARLITLVTLWLTALVPASMAGQDATPAAVPLPIPGVEDAVEWLINQQQEDGSWLGLSGDPDVGTSLDVIIALAAANEAGIDTGDSIDRAFAWLDTESFAADYAAGGPGAAAKLVLALVAVGADSLEIGGTTPLEIVLGGFDADTNLYGFGLYDHSYSLMALAATDSEIEPDAISGLESLQADNGGFSWDGSTDEAMVDSNTTAMLVQALAATGQGEDIIASALGYLRLTVSDEGAGYSIGAEADVNSTALVAQAFIVTGEDATHLLTQLATFQNASGAYYWMLTDVSDNLFSTAQVVPAGVGIALPVMPGALELEEAA